MKKVIRCPNCRRANLPANSRRISFTWWGLIFVPALLQQTECKNCGTNYNGKTGKVIDKANKVITAVFIICTGMVMVIIPPRSRISVLDRILSWFN